MYRWKVSTSGVAGACATRSSGLHPRTRFSIFFPSSSTSTSTIMSLFGSGSGAAPTKTSEDVKNAVVLQLQQEAAMTNARALIGVCRSS